MLPQRSVTMMQLLCAALGIPAAAAGSYSAYQTYFSNDAVCQRLRTAIVVTMERKLAADAKHALLRRDVAEFDKACGDSDPDARAVFQAALQERAPDAAAPEARVRTAAADAQFATPSPPRQPAPSASGEHPGWIALGRGEAAGWVSNFAGSALSETSLLPLGTVLTAQRQLPVWAEPQPAEANDQSKLQHMLPARACVRVLATRPGTGRLWAEVAPASCS